MLWEIIQWISGIIAFIAIILPAILSCKQTKRRREIEKYNNTIYNHRKPKHTDSDNNSIGDGGDRDSDGI